LKEFACQVNMYLNWLLSKGRFKCLSRLRFVLSIVAEDTSALPMTALGAVTLALLTTFVGRVYCGENFMSENYGEVRSADNSRRNHACANRISRRTVCTGI
jgi:hypothetical protein